MSQFVLTNNFHNTEAIVRIRAGKLLSSGQKTRVRQALCGIAGCTCADGPLNIRGPQEIDIYEEGRSGIKLYRKERK